MSKLQDRLGTACHVEVHTRQSRDSVMLLCRLNQTLLHRAIANLALLFLMERMYLFRSGHLRK